MSLEGVAMRHKEFMSPDDVARLFLHRVASLPAELLLEVEHACRVTRSHIEADDNQAWFDAAPRWWGEDYTRSVSHLWYPEIHTVRLVMPGGAPGRRAGKATGGAVKACGSTTATRSSMDFIRAAIERKGVWPARAVRRRCRGCRKVEVRDWETDADIEARERAKHYGPGGGRGAGA